MPGGVTGKVREGRPMSIVASAQRRRIRQLCIALYIDFYGVLKLPEIVDIEMKLRYYET